MEGGTDGGREGGGDVMKEECISQMLGCPLAEPQSKHQPQRHISHRGTRCADWDPDYRT